MIVDNPTKIGLNKLVTSIVKSTNFKQKWFISVQYKSNRANRYNFKKHQFNIISETDTIDKVEKNFKHLKNLLLCEVYNVTNANRIRCNKFRFLHFYELGEAKYNYHSHIVVEDIPDYPTVEDVEGLLEAVQARHKGIEELAIAIDVQPIYSDGWLPYVLKTTTQSFTSLDIINSDID